MIYTKQLKHNDCGAAAVVNASKWAGMDVSLRKHHKFLSKELKIDKYGGTYPEDFISFVKKHKLPFKISSVVEDASKRTIDRNLRNNKAAIFFFREGKKSHIFLLVSETKKCYSCVNYSPNSVVSRLSKDDFLDRIDESTVIFIKRK